MGIKTQIILAIFMIFAASCEKEHESDAYGQFEADEITISSETSGRLLSFTAEEGQELQKESLVAVVDTSLLHLRKEELIATMKSVQSNSEKLDAQKRVLQSQLETAKRELNRLQALHRENAATEQQLDSAEGRVNTLNRQIDAIEVDKQSVSTELKRIEAGIAQINYQIERATIVNPVNGTVLTVFADEYELVTQGRPLYRIADLEEMMLRVYVSGAQLPGIQLGKTVDVLFDRNEEENQQVRGIVSWISSKAEFTPRMIQTKEERVTQVYAVEIRVDNPEGKLKIGMPGEVRFQN